MDQLINLGIALFVVFLITRYLMKSVYIAGESQRFATFKLGRFSGFTGPGLIIGSPYWQMLRLSIGDVGEVTSSEFVQFRGQDVPIKRASEFTVGQAVRIDAFVEDGPKLVVAEAFKRRCPNCNHEF